MFSLCKFMEHFDIPYLTQLNGALPVCLYIHQFCLFLFLSISFVRVWVRACIRACVRACITCLRALPVYAFIRVCFLFYFYQ